ncbi:MAG: thiamine diphosphokinase [Thermotogota bacterium]|nr:thiamine diphosphokinase [Thermotogota bacterium]
MQKKSAVLVGGYPLTHFEKNQINELKGEKSYLIAVDGGLNAFYELAILPDMLLGDMDSCTNTAYDWYCRKGKKQLYFPSNKDYLDMEAAINLVNCLGIRAAFLFGVLGGRIDQTFSCLPFLLRGVALGLSITIKSENCQMGIFKGPYENTFKTDVNSGWSFLAISDVVEGMTLNGFKFDVDKQRLFNTQTRALSNRAKSSKVIIKIDNGILLYFNEPGRQENVEYEESF